LNQNPVHLHPQDRLPFRDHRGDLGSDLAPIKGIERSLPSGDVGTGANVKREAMMAEFDARRALRFLDLEQVAFAPDIMALALNIFAMRLAFLLPEFLLLALDPSEFGDSKNPDGVEVHPRGGRNPDSPAGWIDAQMDIFDVLECHHDIDVANRELLDHQ
jgi:hypothetical protein